LASLGDTARALEHLPLTPPDFLAFETQRLRVEWMTDLRARVGLAEEAQRLKDQARTPTEIAAAADARTRANFYLAHPAW
jgi:hypothetical protein